MELKKNDIFVQSRIEMITPKGIHLNDLIVCDRKDDGLEDSSAIFLGHLLLENLHYFNLFKMCISKT